MFTTAAYEKWLRHLYDHISPNFYRAEPRMRAWAYLSGLADSQVDRQASRKHLATYPGERRADGAQRLLTTAQWDAEQVRSDVVGFVRDRFGACGGKLYVTEMAFRKKGDQAVGVQRQFSLATGRYETCQLGIVLFYETADGSVVLVDRELYVPQSWTGNPARCRRAGMPADLRYRSKSAIGMTLVSRVVAEGIQPDWVLVSLLCADKAHAQQALQQAGMPHVMMLTQGEFSQHGRGPVPSRPHRMTRTTGRTPGFDVAYLADGGLAGGTGHYYAYAPRELHNQHLTEVAGAMWHLDVRGRRSLEDIGIDRYEVRSWRGWYRHMTLAMVAHTAHTLAKTENLDSCAS
jgi:SRSO17 transposase